MTPEEQLKIYGQVLTGTETDLDLTKLQRVNYLKAKLRRKLDLIPFGDTKDNVTDLTKGVILDWAIARGIVTDATLLAQFDALVKAQLEFYGGPEFVLSMLVDNSIKLGDWIGKYYSAKTAIEAAEDEEAVRLVDIEEVAVDPLTP